MAGTYDALIASPQWQADLRSLNTRLVESLTLAGEPALFGGGPFCRHMQNTSILDSKFTTRNERKRRRLFDIARLGRTLFEIGVNGGHSLLLQKSASPALNCIGLDLCQTAGAGNPRADIYSLWPWTGCPVAFPDRCSS